MNKAANPGKTLPVEEFSGKGYHVTQFKTGDLAIFSYLVESNGLALVIDPTIDTQAYKDALAKSKSELKYIVLTHYHADYVAGHTQFGNITILMGEKANRPGLGFEVHEVKSGSNINLGEIKITSIHTPGHTLESTCFLLNDRDGKEEMLFSGDTVFLGEVGRPDLAVSSDYKQEDLAGMLFDSLQKVRVLKPNVKLLPAHGSGSSCGKSIGEGNWCTLEKQFQKNYAFKIQSREEFIKTVTADMPKPPQYFFHDAKMNQEGPKSFESSYKASCQCLSIDQFKEKMKGGAVVIDTRAKHPDAEAGYVKHAYLISDAGSFSSMVGTLFKHTDKLLFFCEKDKVEDIIQRLTRIGYHAEGFNNFTIDEWVKSGGQITKAKLTNAEHAKKLENKLILDVRGEQEAKAKRIEGSLNIPYPKLEANIHQIPKDKTIVVHCKGGMRAKVGGSILYKHGIDNHIAPIAFQEFEKAGFSIVGEDVKK